MADLKAKQRSVERFRYPQWLSDKAHILCNRNRNHKKLEKEERDYVFVHMPVIEVVPRELPARKK